MRILDIGSVLGNYVVVGKVTQAHGIKGEVKIFPYSGWPDDFDFYQDVVLSSEVALGDDQRLDDTSGSGKIYIIEQNRSQGKVAIVRLEGVTSRNDAEPLCGLNVLVKKDKLPPIESGEYYWHDLEGMQVITDDGRKIGKVVSLMATGAHDILVVSDKGREYLIPAKEEFVANIDMDAGSIVIMPPPGLLELNV